MKVFRFIFVFIAFSITAGLHAQALWQAQHHAQRYVLQLDKQISTDTLYLSIPEQYYNRVPLVLKKSGDSIFAENTSNGFKLKAKAIAGEAFTAVFQVYDRTPVNLQFKSVDAIEPLSFPQHPKAPLPYAVEEVTFKGSATGLTYGGTLVLPKKKKNYPLAILISGTGQQERNYTYSGHQFFTVLADALACKGIASLRMDDRGIGETTGDFESATTLDFVYDLEEAIGFVQQNNAITYSKIGLIGHSEGGIIGAMETAKNKDISFFISLSGVAVSGIEILELQNEAILKAYNIPDSLVAKRMDLFSKLFQTVYDTASEDQIETNIRTTVQDWMKTQNTASLKALELLDGRDEDLIYRYAYKAKSNWYRYMIHYKPEDYLSQITVPVLAVNGDADIMVPAKENLEGFKTYIPKRTDLTTKTYKGLNHMYQHCISCKQEESSTLDEVFAPEVLTDIVNWITKRF